MVPLLETALIHNSLLTLAQIGRNRLTAALLISVVATIVSEWNGYPTTRDSYSRALRNAFVRGISIFAVLERIMN